MLLKIKHKVSTFGVGLALLFTFDELMAALPTAVAPSTAPAAGDWLALIKGYAKDGGLVLGLVIAAVGFLWISWMTLSKFNEARTGRAEWGEVGLLGVVAAGVMVFISYLLTEASTTI